MLCRAARSRLRLFSRATSFTPIRHLPGYLDIRLPVNSKDCRCPTCYRNITAAQDVRTGSEELSTAVGIRDASSTVGAKMERVAGWKVLVRSFAVAGNRFVF